MKNNVVAIRHRQKDGNADSLVTPEMRRQICELKRELDQYDNRSQRKLKNEIDRAWTDSAHTATNL